MDSSSATPPPLAQKSLMKFKDKRGNETRDQFTFQNDRSALMAFGVSLVTRRSA